MSRPLEDYALIGNMRTAALVGLDGSIDWMCMPRFDSGACFAAILGGPEHGRWLVGPASGASAKRRRYRGDSLVLETEFEDDAGAIRVIDALPLGDQRTDVIRVVAGLRGRVEVRSELVLRFDYGHIVPWMPSASVDGRLVAEAGPDSVVVDGDAMHHLDDHQRLVATFTVNAGETVAFRVGWHAVDQPAPRPCDSATELQTTEAWWQAWADRCAYAGDHRDAVVRSLLTLKAMSYAPTGSIVAAVTTSIPEHLGGSLNWDYRYCWLRDATFTLLAMIDAGYPDEAVAWREWLLRALAGRPKNLQIMYAVDGTRRLSEIELDWLPGYAQSRPVRIGNAAHEQFQLDVFGEVMDALYQARARGLEPGPHVWGVQKDLLDVVERNWHRPDAGIWELRGSPHHYVHSKVMAWVAFDRGVSTVERFGLDGPVDRWRRIRDEIFTEVCDEGWDPERRTFTQYYGSGAIDAALLQLAPVGFLPADDYRIVGTIAAIEHVLIKDGLVHRYSPDDATDSDALASDDSSFIACSFWLAENYVLAGRTADAEEMFARVIGLRNDLGLLSEEYDSSNGRLVGNFPQAFSHVPLVTTAFALADANGPVQRRSARGRTSGATS